MPARLHHERGLDGGGDVVRQVFQGAPRGRRGLQLPGAEQFGRGLRMPQVQTAITSSVEAAGIAVLGCCMIYGQAANDGASRARVWHFYVSRNHFQGIWPCAHERKTISKILCKSMQYDIPIACTYIMYVHTLDTLVGRRALSIALGLEKNQRTVS